MARIFERQESLVLASASPRRQELLERCGLTFQVAPSSVDESSFGDLPPRELVTRLALLKASAIAEQHSDAWIIGADTVVELGGRIFGKPRDHGDAHYMLSELSGKTHQVWGGMAIVRKRDNQEWSGCSVTKVSMIELSHELIASYVRTGEPLDKAGGYAVQGLAAQFVESIEGSYTNVVGLDITALVRELRGRGIIA